jgi:hypothetical protein
MVASSFAHGALMTTTPGNSPSPKRGLPKGPLILIVLVLATLLGVLWLVRQPPQPAPKLPPLRQVPLEAPEPPRSSPGYAD